MTVQDAWSLPGILGGGVKGNDRYTDGSFFLTVPACSSMGRDGWLDGDVIFLEPYTSWGEQGEVAVSLGLGWRHLFSQQGVGAILQHDGHQAGFWEEGGFIGANVFFDMLDTQFDNRFWQFGFGVEAGTRYLEVRANYYLPLSDRQLAEEIRTQESVTRRSMVPTYHEPFATGHTIQQDVTWSTLESTTTIERLFRRYEDGMEGWDAELALLLPWIDRWMDVKVIGGFYSFDNQPFGPQTGGTGKVEGWKAGLEVRPVPAVVLNATWYKNDRLTGADWTAGVRLEVPFEAGDLGDGKGFWGHIGDAFRPRRRHLAERMAEPVRRQNAAIKTSTSVEEDEEAAEVHVVTKVVSQSKQRIVLAETVVFVDNAIGSPTNPGTYEAPVDTIWSGHTRGNAIFGKDAIVLVQGRPESYNEYLSITQGVRFFGTGSFPGLGNQFFYGRSSLKPTVNGGFFASDVRGTVQITGFNIREGILVNGDTVGIYFLNISNGIVTNNNIQTSGRGYGIFHYTNNGGPTTDGGTRLLVSGNEITGGSTGIYILAGSEYPAFVFAEITGNSIRGTLSDGVLIDLQHNIAASISLIGNSILDSAGNGVAVLTRANSRGDFAITGNVIAGHNLRGLELWSNDTSGASYTITSNLFQGNNAGGIIVGSSDSGPRIDLLLSDNQLIYNQGEQLLVRNGVVVFHSGAFSNDLLDTPWNSSFLYHVSSGTQIGYIFINGFLHPANVDLP